MNTQTPIQYAKQELAAGRFASMPITELVGTYRLCDRDWNILPGSKSYDSKPAAEADRSRILDRARAAIGGAA